MKLKFCGAARCVTGSCHMIEFAGKKFLVDCGMRQGADVKTQYGEGGFPFNPSEIDTVLLTHAHIDHSGLLPLLVRRGFKGRIIATRATAELAGIMLPDSGHIQEQEAEYTNRKNLRAGKPLVEPLYTAQDAVDSLKAFKTVTYNEITEVAPGMRARFADASEGVAETGIRAGNLMAFMAYLMQQSTDRVEPYFYDYIIPSMAEARPELLPELENLILLHPDHFIRNARLIEEAAFEEAGLLAGDLFDSVRIE